MVKVITEPTPEGITRARPPGHTTCDNLDSVMGQVELGAMAGFRHRESKARHAGDFSDALFEERQEVADAGLVHAVQFMPSHVTGVEGDVVEPGRCRRQLLGLRRQVLHVVVLGGGSEKEVFSFISRVVSDVGWAWFLSRFDASRCWA
jgi:hypothetical protein